LVRSFRVSTHPAAQQVPEVTHVPASKWQAPPTLAAVQVSTPQTEPAQLSPTAHSRPQLPQLIASS